MPRGKVRATTPIENESLRIVRPSKLAAGMKGVTTSFRHTLAQSGIKGTIQTMRSVNRFDGFDCPGCAWPDPDNHRSGFEFCENGAKAFAAEATTRRVTPNLFSKYSVSSLSERGDMWMDKQGRLTQPMYLAEDTEHYEPITWDTAFSLIADRIKATDAERVALYTSGRASNEAAFLWGTLARQIGTNNLPDCSNMCHESSGVALNTSIGIGKGTVKLEDFDYADLVLVVGQNPGTNHPRMLSALARCKRKGGSVISINPLEETGMKRFKHPQEMLRMLGTGTAIADDHVPVRINGDSALFKGIAKHLIENNAIDSAFIQKHAIGFDNFKSHLSNVNWKDIERVTGLTEERIREIARIVAQSKRMIICWAMGITQHRNSVPTIHDIVNVLLLGGHFGRKGAGACPVRGHSNVQGDRTVGINHHPSESFLAALDAATGIKSPRERGVDSVQLIQRSIEGKCDVLLCLGGNLLSAMSDTEVTAKALQKIGLTVQISTKLNRSHVITGKEALILPCLGRTEEDIGAAGNRFVTVENSMGVVHSSRGTMKPASEQLMSEPDIVANIGDALFGSSPIQWTHLSEDYDRIRSLIESVVPGFDDYNNRVREDGGFYLPNGPRDGPIWNTSDGKAVIHSHPLDSFEVEDGYTMMTIRSHDQYNTTIYGMDDRYRGIKNARRIVFMNPEDMIQDGITSQQEVNLISIHDGVERRADRWKVVPYSIPRGNIATYFPEANVLIPLESVAIGSNTPTSKSVHVRIES